MSPARRLLKGAATSLLLLTPVLGLASTAVAQSTSDPAQSDDAPEITIESHPRWGQGPVGAWTSYITTVRNDGFRNLEAEVVLVPTARPAAGTPPGSFDIVDYDGIGRAPASVLGALPDDQKDEDEDLAAGGSVRASPPLVEAAPQTWPVYRTRIVLAPGTEKTVTTVLIEAPYGYRSELRDVEGDLLASSAGSSTVVGRNQWSVALLTRDQASIAVPVGVHVVRLDSADDFPDDPLLLTGLQEIMLFNFDSASLSPDQISTLRTFVGQGGALILGGGSTWSDTLAALPEELVPFRPSSTIESTVDAFPTAISGRTVVGRVFSDTPVTLATGELRHGEILGADRDGVPLLVEGVYGTGTVVQATYDPLAGPFRSDGVLQQAVIAAAGGPGLEHLRLDVHASPPENLWESLLRRTSISTDTPWSRWPGWAMAVAGGYCLLMLPFLRFLRGRSRGPELAWAAVPLAGFLMAALLGVASPGQPTSLPKNLVEVETIGPDGTALVRAYHGFFGPDSRAGGGSETRTDQPWSVTTEPGTLASTILAEPWVPDLGRPGNDPSQAWAFGQPAAVAWAGQVGGSSTRTSPDSALGGSTTHIRVAEDGRSVVTTQHAQPERVYPLQTLSVVRGSGALSGDVRVEDRNTIPGRDPDPVRATGTITNSTGRTVREVTLHVGKTLASVAEVIEPGATVTFDVVLAADQTRAAIEEAATVARFGSLQPTRVTTRILYPADPDRRAVAVAVDRTGLIAGGAVVAALAEPRSDFSKGARAASIHIVTSRIAVTLSAAAP